MFDGSPSTTVLWSTSISPLDVSTSFQFISLDLPPAALNVNGGDLLTLVLRSDALAQGGGIDPYGWYGDTVAGYGQGTVFLDYGFGFMQTGGWDVGFRTYVDTTVPEPSTWFLLLFGTGIMFFARSRRLSLIRRG